jgi:hypothetical protein
MNSMVRKYWPLLALVALFACSKSRSNDLIFDPDVGHTKSWIKDHGPASVSAEHSCEQCHGSDLQGGISQVGCSLPSMGGTACHEGGPGIGHSAGWRGAHSATGQEQASVCAQCHRNPAVGGAPGCFNNTLCHGAKSQHPGDWRGAHKGTPQGHADQCAQCHRSRSGTAGCFNGTLCHSGAASPHDGSWRSSAHKTQSNPNDCAQCHRSSNGDAGCFNGTLCHGGANDPGGGNPHAGDWKSVHKTQSNPNDCVKCHRSNVPGDVGCFNGTLCHGGADDPGGGNPHDSDWKSKHKKTSPGQAGDCAKCHEPKFDPPECFNGSLCHGGDDGDSDG